MSALITDITSALVKLRLAFKSHGLEPPSSLAWDDPADALAAKNATIAGLAESAYTMDAGEKTVRTGAAHFNGFRLEFHE